VSGEERAGGTPALPGNETARLDELPVGEAEAAFLACCGCRRWARAMAGRPYGTAAALAAAADRHLDALEGNEWLEAFAAHPQIGETGKGGAWAKEEQAGVADADAAVRAELARANRLYGERFGHIFIVCATGKSAGEMLALLRRRLANDAQTELAVAALEQRKITHLRLAKLLAE
jgi:OHCU decarboxylase